jgi:glycosyltransferase involved in cell wall biosynthesis
MRVLCSAMLRIKNESRWIRLVLKSIKPVCHKIFILDDNSTDKTASICREFNNAIVFPSPFSTLDESRDKNWLYQQVLNYGEYERCQWPEWLLCIDGDEVLESSDAEKLIAYFQKPWPAVAYKFRILYLWQKDKIRIDGVYKNFSRPSAFRIFNPSFKFQKTPFGNGANFHCSSIPQELLYKAEQTDIRFWHLGYIDPEIRIKKWKWYNSIDPGNIGEGYDPNHPERGAYPHIVQGDIPEVPADAKLMHAGPIELKPVLSI